MSLLPARDLGVLPPAGPLYLRLRRLLRAAIETDALPPGALLPSERALGETYGLSRVTVRKAIDGLVSQGVIERRHGSGAFVATASVPTSPVEKRLSGLSSFSEDMAARGLTAGSRWLGRRTGAATSREAQALGLSPGAAVHRLRRVRLADGEPVSVEATLVAGFALSSLEAVNGSLYEVLAISGFRPARAEHRIRAEPAGPERASLLRATPDQAGLAIERRAFLPDGRTVEVTQAFYRGDACDLVMDV